MRRAKLYLALYCATMQRCRLMLLNKDEDFPKPVKPRGGPPGGAGVPAGVARRAGEAAADGGGVTERLTLTDGPVLVSASSTRGPLNARRRSEPPTFPIAVLGPFSTYVGELNTLT